jgi:hypothetical protein
MDGYVFDTTPGGAFWDTHNGGETWTQPTLSAGGELLGFGIGVGYAFALVGKCQNGGCADVELERSPVTSDAWTALSLPVPASGVDPLATMAVHGSDLWVSLTTSDSQPSQLLVVGTGSGASFTTYQSPCSSGLGGTIQATSAEVLWAVCPSGMMSEAFRSTDGGAQWVGLTSAGELVNSAVLAPASDTTAVIEPSSQGPLLRTTDGGASWANVPPTVSPGSSGAWWSWIGFTDSLTGSALLVAGSTPADWPWPDGPSPESLWRTDDGGLTWSGPVSFG